MHYFLDMYKFLNPSDKLSIYGFLRSSWQKRPHLYQK